MPKLTFKKIKGHARTIRKHRKWVRYYCTLSGIMGRGIKHDLSKYSPKEFFESARYWTGTTSPINIAKQEQGVSYAWLHHKGRNTHHYEYWMDNFDDGGIARMIPRDDFTELVCDYLGAARAYLGSEFSFQKELEWWSNKRTKCAMNIKNKRMLDTIFSAFAMAERKGESPETMMMDHYIQKIWEKYND